MDTPVVDTKALFAPKKGKQATKGQKQIYEGNLETLKFFSLIAFIAVLLKSFSTYRWPTYLSLSFTIFSILIQSAAILGMRFMAKPILSGPSKTVVDGGLDLNLPGGFAERLKDIIITTAACSIISTFSEGFWVLWLWLPGYYTYEIWVNVISPWIFQPAPEQNEISDKKRRKLERKMARAGYNR